MAPRGHDEPDLVEADGRQSVLGLLNWAIAVKRSQVHNNIARARHRNPEATPEQVTRSLERMYVTTLAGTGAVTGAATAAPGVGTGLALTLWGGQTLATFVRSAVFMLSLADVHGVPILEVERRQTLMMGILLGEAGTATIARVSERTGKHWAREVVGNTPLETLRKINRILGNDFITKYGNTNGIIVLNDLVPAVFGAVIGSGLSFVAASGAVAASRLAFGAPPTSWPRLTRAAVIPRV
ncbi:hypothetical protein I0C86_13795 [Plantactinospora sp. S1510]|uniref:EcsC family protein n=1 Tax=Plantactinospora alkalitolerans TaxID=2789879 RepID=A0ABS0GV10_9ACTN|nr:hypothetical protein [Plantactinospora alkalitolerans]MBF9130022.1 hypothetical protein [Plantactinospora alkalitolerans]